MDKRILLLKKTIEEEILHHHSSIKCLQDALDILESAKSLDLKTVTEALEIMNNRLDALKNPVETEQKSLLC